MTIEGNKDEAEKCIEIAQNAFSAGNAEKAERFLLKAERLYPSPRSKELLARVRAAGSTGNGGKKTPPRSPNAEEMRRRKAPTHQTPQREFTTDQLEAVRRINTKCKDYYEILGKIELFIYFLLHVWENLKYFEIYMLLIKWIDHNCAISIHLSS